MKKVLLAVGAAALAVSMPAFAKGPNGKGASAKAQHSLGAKHKIKSKGHAKDARARARARSAVPFRDTNGDGLLDARDVIDRDRNGIDDRAQNRYGGADCPPGLAKKSPACVPPGQAKRQFAQGQRIPSSYNALTGYNAIPEAYRSQVPYSPTSRYIYRDNQVYVVDPATRAVTSIINLIR